MTDAFRMLLVWFGTVSALTLFLFGWDKLMAKLGRRRIPEAALLGAALCGYLHANLKSGIETVLDLIDFNGLL